MKRFVLWAAVSSQPQVEKVSLEDQIEQGRRHAERWGGQVVAELVVPGESRDIVLFEDAARRISAYADLRRLITERSFDVFVFLNRSRLGRTAALSMTVVELLTRAGILPYDMESPPPSLDRPRHTHAGLLTGAIQSVGAQVETLEFRRRHEMGMAERVRKGEFPGRIPWGWLLRWEVAADGKPLRRVEVDPTARATWRMILDLYLTEQLGPDAIADRLRNAARPTPNGGEWWGATVRWLLDRVWLFAGYVELNRTSPTGRPHVKARSIWPAVISEADAEAVAQARNARRILPRQSTNPHRFSGVVWCVQCQRAKVGESNPKYGRSYVNYRCKLTRHPGAKISERKVSAAVEIAIRTVTDQAAGLDLSYEAPDQAGPIRQQLDTLAGQLEELHAARLRADDAYIDGKLDADRYSRQIARLDEQEAALSAQIAQAQAALHAAEHADRGGERLLEVADLGLAMLEEPDLRVANAWFRRHVRVWIYPDRTITVEIL